MASTNKTSNGLNQWEMGDYPKMADFNSDNAIIDEAVTKSNNPLAQIAAGSIPAEKLMNNALSFGIIIPRKEGPVDLPSISASKLGDTLCIYAGANIELSNWNEGLSKPQLYIGVKDILSLKGESLNVDLATTQGIYIALPSSLGTLPKDEVSGGIIFSYASTGYGGRIVQTWIGKGIFQRVKNSGSGWGVWQSQLPDMSNYQKIQGGSTPARPINPKHGECYLDDNLGSIPIWWNETRDCWVNYNGAPVI